MTEPSIIERVAKAICDSSDQYCFWRKAVNQSVCAGCLNQARAAIAAMREPTEEMKGEGYHDNCHMCGGHLEGWQRMIDTALKETTP